MDGIIYDNVPTLYSPVQSLGSHLVNSNSASSIPSAGTRGAFLAQLSVSSLVVYASEK